MRVSLLSRSIAFISVIIALTANGYANWPPPGSNWPPPGGGGPFTTLPGYTSPYKDAAGNPAPFDWSANEKFQDAIGALALVDPAAASEILTGLLQGAVNFYAMDRNSSATGITANGGNAVILDLTRPLEEVVVTLIHEWTHVRNAAGATVAPDGTVVEATPMPLTGGNIVCSNAHAYAAALDLIVKLQQNFGTNPLFKCSFIKHQQEKCEENNLKCDWAAPPPGPAMPTCKDLVSELSGNCL